MRASMRASMLLARLLLLSSASTRDRKAHSKISAVLPDHSLGYGCWATRPLAKLLKAPDLPKMTLSPRHRAV
ncbi:hypothetical protein GQ53DRAFT_746457 [Thozetella sp. PMI_491]|nr:hypothetical protein GQ53DRAFT_746457 [Thozetella sp. PMI_491]